MLTDEQLTAVASDLNSYLNNASEKARVAFEGYLAEVESDPVSTLVLQGEEMVRAHYVMSAVDYAYQQFMFVNVTDPQGIINVAKEVRRWCWDQVTDHSLGLNDMGTELQIFCDNQQIKGLAKFAQGLDAVFRRHYVETGDEMLLISPLTPSQAAEMLREAELSEEGSAEQ